MHENRTSRKVVNPKRPGSTIIGKVKCSQNLFDDIEKYGGTAVMAKAGHLISLDLKKRNHEITRMNTKQNQWFSCSFVVNLSLLTLS